MAVSLTDAMHARRGRQRAAGLSPRGDTGTGGPGDHGTGEGDRLGSPNSDQDGSPNNPQLRELIEHRDVPLAHLIPSPRNPRFLEDEASDRELLDSVRANGVIVPLMVRPAPDHLYPAGFMKDASGQLYEILAGHRRYRAALAVGLTTVPAVVRELDDLRALELMAAETIGGRPLKPIEQARMIAGLLEGGRSPQEVADELGASPEFVARRSKLNDLSKSWRELACTAGSFLAGWPVGILERVAVLAAPVQEQVLKQLNAFQDWSRDRVPTLKQFDLFLAEHFTFRLSAAPWNLDDALLCPKAGSCAACLKRSGAQPTLFEVEPNSKPGGKGDVCLDRLCWSSKAARRQEQVFQSLAREHPNTKVLAISSTHYGKELDAVRKQFGSKLVNEYQVKPSKKGAKGAVPLVHVDGPRQGTVEWVIPPATQRREKVTGDRGQKEKAKPRTLAELRAELTCRRGAWALDQLGAALDKLRRAKQLPDLLLDTPDVRLLALVAAFGSMPEEYVRMDRSDWKRFDQLALADRRLLRRLVWRGLLENFSELLPTGINYPDALNTGARIAELIGLDWPALLKQSEAELPEPPAWSKLNADGTVKSLPAGGGKTDKETRRLSDKEKRKA